MDAILVGMYEREAREQGIEVTTLTVPLAITAGPGLSAIGATIHPCPTQAGAIRKLVAYPRSRLAPFVQQVLGH